MSARTSGTAISLGSVLLLAAIGLAITFGVMGVINMAHGEMVMIGAYTTFVVQNIVRASAPELFDYSLAFRTAGGLPRDGAGRHRHRAPPPPASSAGSLWPPAGNAARNMGYLADHPAERALDLRRLQPRSQQPLMDVGRLRLLRHPHHLQPVLDRAVLAGRLRRACCSSSSAPRSACRLRAVTQNRRMASSMGIRTPWVDAMTFGLGSGIAGLAGVALSQIDNVSPNLGQGYIIDSFMVVVFGGVGNLWGTLVGALTLGVLNKFLEPYAGAVLAKIAVLVLVILFIQKRPRGLVSRSRAGRWKHDHALPLQRAGRQGVDRSSGILVAGGDPWCRPPTCSCRSGIPRARAQLPWVAAAWQVPHLRHARARARSGGVMSASLSLGHGAFFVAGRLSRMACTLMRQIGDRGVYSHPPSCPISWFS